MVAHDSPYILVKKATIFWNYNSISHKVNKEITYNSVKKTLNKRYWTFSIVKKETESYGTVSLQLNEYDGTYSLTSDNIINFINFGSITGFDQNKTFNANTKRKSGPVNINSGLKFINISCNISDTHNKIYMDAKSDSLVSLAITSTQSLKGSVQHYKDIESKIEIDKGIIYQR